MQSKYSDKKNIISREEHEKMKDFSILIGGYSNGNIMAECILRLGFECLSIISNENNNPDILKKQLISINNGANISVHPNLLTLKNPLNLIRSHDIAINNYNINSKTYPIFNKLCRESNLHVLNPFNLGWGCILTVISPDGLSYDHILKQNEKFSLLNIVEYTSTYMEFWREKQEWLIKIQEMLQDNSDHDFTCNLATSDYMLAAMISQIIFNIATDKSIKTYPDFYIYALH